MWWFYQYPMHCAHMWYHWITRNQYISDWLYGYTLSPVQYQIFYHSLVWISLLSSLDLAIGSISYESYRESHMHTTNQNHVVWNISGRYMILGIWFWRNCRVLIELLTLLYTPWWRTTSLEICVYVMWHPVELNWSTIMAIISDYGRPQWSACPIPMIQWISCLPPHFYRIWYNPEVSEISLYYTPRYQ